MCIDVEQDGVKTLSVKLSCLSYLFFARFISRLSKVSKTSKTNMIVKQGGSCLKLKYDRRILRIFASGEIQSQ